MVRGGVDIRQPDAPSSDRNSQGLPASASSHLDVALRVDITVSAGDGSDPSPRPLRNVPQALTPSLRINIIVCATTSSTRLRPQNWKSIRVLGCAGPCVHVPVFADDRVMLEAHRARARSRRRAGRWAADKRLNLHDFVDRWTWTA
jgi:hypothetical protein